MMALAPVNGSAATTAAQGAFGLDFQSVLKIILTQLTYQDPLKPLDNTEFVSQLAQFSQLQQTQSLNDQVTSLLAAQSASQATGLLGRTVEITSQQGGAALTGKVETIAFASGKPTLTIVTAAGERVSGIGLETVAVVRQ
jgi:flagellar basal-body rod modification protein FlgD